jgi:hypothetical protein
MNRWLNKSSPRTRRLLALALIVVGLYFAVEFGRSLGRALFRLTH